MPIGVEKFPQTPQGSGDVPSNLSYRKPVAEPRLGYGSGISILERLLGDQIQVRFKHLPGCRRARWAAKCAVRLTRCE
jgi:hypothetical protein